jgi:alkylated DNA repair dioxygenase AlkB
MLLFQTPENQVANCLPSDGIVVDHGVIFPKEEAAQFLATLLTTIPWEQDELIIFGRKIITQRKTAWYGDLPYAYTYSHATKVALPWTPALCLIKEKVELISGQSYNSCLLNLYHDGNEGMGWHSDDEDTIARDSAIASVSLGAARRFDFRHKKNGEKVQVMLENGSLLVMKAETQRFWQHSLPKSKRISAPRVNLTFRRMIE